MENYRLAVDIGGTFTDLFFVNEDTGEQRVSKVPSQHDALSAVLSGIERAGVAVASIRLLTHGTTVATNALIQRKFPRTAMVTTKGFRDVVEIGRATKDDLWDTYYDLAMPYIPRRDRLVVPERIGADGAIIEALDEEAARKVAAILKKRGIRAVAVCFINSFKNPAHEQQMGRILMEELGEELGDEAQISLSSEVLPEIFEHERFSTTIVNACVSPVIGPYIRKLNEGLKAKGYSGELLMFHSGGGVLPPVAAQKFGARFAGSGIAAGAIAAARIASNCGFPNSIGLDMGGTSTDIAIAVDGKTSITNDWFIEFGYPIGFPALDVRTIGAGGGSLAWIDDGGGLRNGPQSAGSDPGPAAYGKGNSQATNTDANLVLSRLGTKLLGGYMSLDKSKAEQAVKVTVADHFGLSITEAAQAIIRIANTNMAEAVRTVSIGRGHDPRDFALVAFGGAGPLHGAAVARELDIPTVIIPANPGVTSALGCMLVDLRHDLAAMILRRVDELETGDLKAAFGELEKEGAQRLASEGVPAALQKFEYSVDMRYLGQWRSISIPVTLETLSLEGILKAFHDGHQREYSYRRDDAPAEIFRINIVAIGLTPPLQLKAHEPDDSEPIARERRQVYFDDSLEPFDTAVYQRADLRAGHSILGPAIIEQVDSTVLIPPGTPAVVDRYLNIILTV